MIITATNKPFPKEEPIFWVRLGREITENGISIFLFMDMISDWHNNIKHIKKMFQKFTSFSIIILFFMFILISCDPSFKVYKLKNNTTQTIYAGTYFIKDSLIFHIPYLEFPIKVLPKKEQTISKLMHPISYDFNWAKKKLKDSTLEIVVFEHNPITDTIEFENNPLIYLNKYFSTGKYWVKPYTYGELKEKKFKVVFPDDGFKKGKPVKLYNAYEVIDFNSE